MFRPALLTSMFVVSGLLFAPPDVRSQDKTAKSKLIGKWETKDSEREFRTDGYVTGTFLGAEFFLEPDDEGFMGKGYRLKYKIDRMERTPWTLR